ncbi:MAG TPA: alpha-mannosidase, partial [Firmicutes bacterium]|nr:alpha-mannosidase [Bacillota bacterium]
TFATALMMMEHYPDYIFGASQPQLYQWMKVYYPELYQKVQKRVSEGRWETLGAMWVEADMNLPGGESLVRQLLYGKRFFQKEFGQTVKIAWLPDSFGYTAALPQLLKKSGIDYFCTTKLSWNLYNQLPHHTFIWEGIDGSPVLTHMPPESTYNSSASPRAVVKSETSYLDKGVSDQCLMLFGIGDGGGGPGEEHLEMLNREKQTADLAPVQQQKAGQFFEELAHDKEKYQSWHGDLYLERHQGTYTTRAHNKRNNRKIEIALHELEFLAVLAEIFTKTPYPAEELETIWKEVLLYQFHDILPGSAIARVYLETDSRYEILFHWILQLKEQALKALLQVMDSTWCQNPALIINSTSWARQEWLKIGDNWYRVQIPGMGCRVIDLNLSSTPPSGMIADKFCLENDQLRVEWANDGSISRIYDKTNRFEVLAPGAYGNRLAVYQDNGDAWDIPIGYADQKPDYFQLTGISSQVDGPRASVKHSYRYGNSQLEQEIVIFEGSRRIDFITKVDWRERHKMLRVAFPLNIQNGAAVGEIQFGSLERPSHRNTTWDMAKYEIYAHKWLDLSNSGYGAALLNDCKYGYKVFKNILDLNLLRSPSYPDPQTDLGTHEFTYALFPHSGNHLNGRVNEQGYQLNYPLSVRKILQRVRGLAREISLLTIHPENIIIETVKKAEESPAFIIRLYESAGSFTRAKLVFHLPVESVQLVDLMEQPYDGVHLGPELKLEFMPFEIQTLKVKCVSIPME